MKNKVFPLFLTILLVGFLSGCDYDNEEELYPDNICLTDNMSYSSDVLPILEDNCYVCHNQATNTGGVTLEGYTKLKMFVDSEQLLGVIKHEDGFQPMPNGLPQLIQCQIDKIEAWINQGALNN